MPSEVNSPRTFTQRSSPLHSPLSSNESVQKVYYFFITPLLHSIFSSQIKVTYHYINFQEGGEHIRLHSPYRSPSKYGLDKALSDIVLYNILPKGFFHSYSVSHLEVQIACMDT